MSTIHESPGVLDELGRRGVVPVLVVDDVTTAAPLARALVAGGLPLAEVTFRTAAASEVLRVLAAEADLLVGAGTVLSRDQADAAAFAGARFLVSPGLDPGLVRHCQDLGLPVLPGVATATEIQGALALGLTTVKFFPAEPAGGLRLLGALSAPFPSLRFVPTGGIRPDSLRSYLEHPAVHAVGGSWLAGPELLGRADWAEVTQRARAAVAVVEATRGRGGSELPGAVARSVAAGSADNQTTKGSR